MSHVNYAFCFRDNSTMLVNIGRRFRLWHRTRFFHLSVPEIVGPDVCTAFNGYDQ